MAGFSRDKEARLEGLGPPTRWRKCRWVAV